MVNSTSQGSANPNAFMPEAWAINRRTTLSLTGVYYFPQFAECFLIYSLI